MVRILLNGAAGRMGRVVAELASQNPNTQVVAGVDAMAQGQDLGFPLFDSLEACTVQADVLVDFSRPAALKDILSYACEHMMPVVLATTGYTPGDLERIHRAAKSEFLQKVHGHQFDDRPFEDLRRSPGRKLRYRNRGGPSQGQGRRAQRNRAAPGR